MAWFEYKGVKSSDLGIVVEKMPSIVIPSNTFNDIDIPDAEVKTSVPGRLEGFTYAFECRLNEVNPAKYREIAKWLKNEEGNDKLIRSDEDDKYYKAKVINNIPFEKVIKKYTRFIVHFECEPYAYSNVEEVVTLTNKSNILLNPGVYESRPVMKIYGNGSLKIKVNGQQITFSSVVNYITMDCLLFECYKDDALMNANMNGTYPTLTLGENTIELVENVTKIEVSPNWRY